MPPPNGIRGRRLNLIVDEVRAVPLHGGVYLTQMDRLALCLSSDDARQRRGKLLASGHGRNHRADDRREVDTHTFFGGSLIADT